MSSIFGLISEIVTMAPGLIKAGLDIKELVERAYDVVQEQGMVGDPDWDRLEQQIALLKQGALYDTSRDV